MQDAPFLLKFAVALAFVIAIGIVLVVGAAVQIYILGWLLGLLGSLF
ncbi:MAG: hypothetical protein OEM67_01555 [Thermoleophilia bacterium]|nr:hypothetical protein [Thermoleophilia bacterium]MDH3725481.1 hypothetical protein [Thermoleophilia bacterium]